MNQSTCATNECDRPTQARGMCTTHWSRWYRANRKQTRTCDACGETFETARSETKHCSLDCHNAHQARGGRRVQARDRHRTKGRHGSMRWRALRRAEKAALGTTGGARIWVQGDCILCGVAFMSPGAGSKYCSRPCRQVDRSNRMYGLTRIDRTAIFNRDVWTCCICTEPVDPDAPSTSDWYPTLDHIVPRSHGGSNALTNLRTAHRWCNSVRGDLKYYTDADLAPAN